MLEFCSEEIQLLRSLKYYFVASYYFVQVCNALLLCSGKKMDVGLMDGGISVCYTVLEFSTAFV